VYGSVYSIHFELNFVLLHTGTALSDWRSPACGPFGIGFDVFVLHTSHGAYIFLSVHFYIKISAIYLYVVTVYRGSYSGAAWTLECGLWRGTRTAALTDA